MLQSFYTGLSGMFSFSRGLDTVSNNITNVNTPGFRGSDNFFRSVNGSNGQGVGTALEGTTIRLQEGEIRSTGNDTDMALQGEGYFILRDSAGSNFYTRAGQFRFDSDNVLIDSVTGFEVIARGDSGNLLPVDISQFRVLAPEATTQIALRGNLLNGSQLFEIPQIEVFSPTGDSNFISISFTEVNDIENAWDVIVNDISGNSLGSNQIRFNTNGSLQENFNNFSLDLVFGDETQTVLFDFGSANSIIDSRQSNQPSDIAVDDIDGNRLLGITSLEFNEEGLIKITYSNGDVIDGPRIALATFDNELLLENVSGSLYKGSEELEPIITIPGSSGTGFLRSGSIELSNVDLTQEFADILIVQRGYQASSRVMTVSNELIEQLYNGTGR